MSQTNLDAPSDNDDDEDEIEPKLKYVRLLNDFTASSHQSSENRNLLISSSATCLVVHSKFICIGTNWGTVHVLDHQGNPVQGLELRSHTVAVNAISIDKNGEYIGTCSDDGHVLIQALFKTASKPDDNRLKVSMGRLVKCLALDPNYGVKLKNQRFITGDEQNLIMHEKSLFLGALKPTNLIQGSAIRALNWGPEDFVAWTSKNAVRIFDVSTNHPTSLGVIKFDVDSDDTSYRCNLRWTNGRTLFIGWGDEVRICIVRRNTNQSYVVDCLVKLQMDFFVCGLAPLNHQQMVLLGTGKVSGDRPQLFIIEYQASDYSDICTDSLTLRGFENCHVNDYHLDVLPDENRFFIMAPKDVVVANTFDLDDKIQWYLQHGKFEEALNLLTQQTKSKQYTVQSVGIQYLDALLARGQFDTAGKLCWKIFTTDTNAPDQWEEQIYKFATAHQLRAISPYIPQTKEYHLNPHIYEMVLYEYLKLDCDGFLQKVHDWNPDLYNVNAVVNAVSEHLSFTTTDSDQKRSKYLEALALLYSYQGKFDQSVSTYLKLKNTDVFHLIEHHKLYDMIAKILPDLMELDWRRTIQMLLISEVEMALPLDTVVTILKSNSLHLFRYLDEYEKRNGTSGKAVQYHNDLVRLYAIFDRDGLLPFLRKSDHYRIQGALEICQNDHLYPETVYLLGRMGDTKIALEIIMGQLKDIQYAINFCQEHNDPDLWIDLIRYSIDNCEYITFLLRTMGTYVDPTILVEGIRKDMIIPGLKQSLVKMLNQYKLTLSIQEDCKNIVVGDYFKLQQKLVRGQKRGVGAFYDYNLCGICHKNVICQLSTTTSSSQQCSNPSAQYLIAFNCSHWYHTDCLTDTKCHICHHNS